MTTQLQQLFRPGRRGRVARPLPWMDRVARRGLASSGALAGLVALAGSAALPTPAAAQDPFACGADQMEKSFGLRETVEMWDVPPGVDSVRVIAAGGRGGEARGGSGALVAGTFPVTPEATLHIIVAGQGGSGRETITGGGGGSFVGVGGFEFVDENDTQLLLVAGGGGGRGGSRSGGNAGLPGSNGDPGGGPGGGLGGGGDGTGGSGGCNGGCGGGGGGASAGSDGADGDEAGGGAGAGGNGGGFDPSRTPAMAAVNGGAGGEGFFDDNGGGFGGGGGGGDGPAGGGGGGFAGGGGGTPLGGGGGSSFRAPTASDPAAELYTGNDGFVTICYVPPPPPTFSKSFAPASIAPGETSTLTFSIDNTSSAADVGNLQFTDELPAGVTVADPANPSDECGGTLTAAPGQGTIEYTGGTVDAGASCTISLEVTSATPGSHENTTSELESSAGTSEPATTTLEVGEVTTTFEVETATGTGTATGSISGGGPGCEVAGVEALEVTEVAPERPAGVELPHGLIALELAGCDEGAEVEVALTLPSAIGSEYWKYGPTSDQQEDHWYMAPASVSDATVTFTIVDGGLGDSDLEANGTIVDPGGPSGVPPVPTLPRLVLLLLLALLSLAAVRMVRRSDA